MTRKRLKKLIMSYKIQRNEAEKIIASYSSIGFSNESILNVIRIALIANKAIKHCIMAIQNFRKHAMEALDL